MDAELGDDAFGIDQHVEQMRHRRTLITSNIGHTRLQQRLGNRENAFAVKDLTVAEP